MTTPHEKAAEALRLAHLLDGRYALSHEDHMVSAALLRDYAALLQAQPAEAGRVPPGWKLVPVEPTDEMVGAMAVVEASSVINGVRCVGISGAVEAFEAMLAAAPQPQKEQP